MKTSLDGKSSPLNTTTTTQSWCWLSCRPPVHLLAISRRRNPRRSCSGHTVSHTWSPTSTSAPAGCPAQGHGVGAQRHLAPGNYTGLPFSCAITWQNWARVFTWLLHRFKPYTTWLEEWRSQRTCASNAFANHGGNALLAPVTRKGLPLLQICSGLRHHGHGQAMGFTPTCGIHPKYYCFLMDVLKKSPSSWLCPLSLLCLGFTRDLSRAVLHHICTSLA